MALGRLLTRRLATARLGRACRTRGRAWVFAPTLVAVPILILLLSGSAAAAPSCDVTTDPASGFAIGPTQVRIIAASTSSTFSDAGSIRIWAAIDYAQQPRLIGQASRGSFGANGSLTVDFSTADTHHIWVACQAASGETTAETDFRIFPPGILFVGFGAIVLLGLVAKVAAGGVTGSAPTTVPVQPQKARPVPTSAEPLLPTESAMTVGPLSDTQSPRLLSEQPSTAQRTKVQRCHDAVGDRDALIGLLLRKRELESKITVEWLQKATTARALLERYRALCDTKLYTWLATGDNVVEKSAAVTYKLLSFVRGGAELRKRFNSATRAVERDHVTAATDEITDRIHHTIEEQVGGLLDDNAKEHGESTNKMADALGDDIAEYVTLASGHNVSLRRWHAEREAAMQALDREIDVAHRALASSHWDCHGRLLPLDDSALHGANADSLGSEWRSAIGQPADLEVPENVAFRGAR